MLKCKAFIDNPQNKMLEQTKQYLNLYIQEIAANFTLFPQQFFEFIEFDPIKEDHLITPRNTTLVLGRSNS
jgi:hypothetical protein